jgi:hypothetical protein
MRLSSIPALTKKAPRLEEWSFLVVGEEGFTSWGG